MGHNNDDPALDTPDRVVQKKLIREALGRNWAPETWGSDQACIYALLPEGKLFRSLLLLDVIEAFGGDSRRFIPAAAGIEYAHVGSLIHDDIIDGDTLRRGRSAVSVKFGMNTAVVAGDELIFQLFATLAKCRSEQIPDDHLLRSISVLAEAGVDLCRGEIAEEKLAGNLTATTEEYLATIELKTAALFRATCQTGAILGGAEPVQIDRLREYGRCLGIAFQIQDDILPYGTWKASGKSRLSDIKNKRATLPILFAYAHAESEDRERLAWLLASTELPPAEAHEHLIPILTRTGALELARDLGEEYTQRAREQLDLLNFPHHEKLLNYTILANHRSH